MGVVHVESFNVLAVAAHPDDIEIMMAGTLLHLKDAGAKIHMWSLANGSCGTTTLERGEIAKLRWEEAQASAKLAKAQIHQPLVDDLMIFYDAAMLQKVASVIRSVQPTIILTHSPQDYMEDHQNTCRLVVTAAFARGMRNFIVKPQVPVWEAPMTIYHACPHGLRDSLRNLVRPNCYVDIESKLATKRAMLDKHQSQAQWLGASQGMDSMLAEMEEMGRELGRMSGLFKHAEGWRRHSHLGFAAEGYDPLFDELGAKCWVDPAADPELGQT
jgi:N-acetylglucosamine malate deacetylase 1